jgi:competence protein ComEA
MVRHRLLPLVLIGALALISSAPVDAQTMPPGNPAPKGSEPTVNLNTATLSQLTALPGVGERTAQLIIEYRDANGPFKRIEDLMNVRGIGEKVFLRLKPLIAVTPVRGDRAASPSA